MKQVTLTLLVAFSSSLFGQDDKVGMTLIENWIRQVNPAGQIIYADKLDKWEIDAIRKRISRRKFTGITLDTKQNSLKLTRQEQEYILQQTELLRTNIWKDNLFVNSQRIVSDSAMTYVKKRRSDLLKIYDSVNDSVKNTMRKDIIHTNVFMFSKPIFIRDNSICLLYTMHLCGGQCGETELSFYKLTNGNWNKFVVAGMGTF